MKNADAPIDDFSSSNNLQRLFKARFGMALTDYRRFFGDQDVGNRIPPVRRVDPEAI